MGAKLKFTQADLKRAVAGVTAAGIPIGRIEIDPNGRIVILPATGIAAHDNDEWADLA